MEKMKIGEVASRSGFSASAIRYYESVGVLPRPGRESGRRIYDQSVLTMLRWINLSQDAGFSVEEIKKLLHGFPASATPSQRWRELASAKIVELDESISRARKMKKLLREGLRCRCESLKQCIPAAKRVRARPGDTRSRTLKASPRRVGMRGRW
jgi:MerR family redox-sensitive transcriptional activator SoxR